MLTIRGISHLLVEYFFSVENYILSYHMISRLLTLVAWETWACKPVDEIILGSGGLLPCPTLERRRRDGRSTQTRLDRRRWRRDEKPEAKGIRRQAPPFWQVTLAIVTGHSTAILPPRSTRKKSSLVTRDSPVAASTRCASNYWRYHRFSDE